MAKEFKKHMMYSPDGRTAEVNTREDHLRYKELGWSHNPKTTPINQVSGYNSPLTQVNTTPPAGTNWFKEANQAAMGGGGLGSGYEGTGYTINWSGIDFGKADLQKKMNSNEGESTDPGGKKKRCARKGGVWNEETGRCDMDGGDKKGKEGETHECDDCKGGMVTMPIDVPCFDCSKLKKEEEECDCDNLPVHAMTKEHPCYEKCGGDDSRQWWPADPCECEDGTPSKINSKTGKCDCDTENVKKEDVETMDKITCDAGGGTWVDGCGCCGRPEDEGKECCDEPDGPVDRPDGPVDRPDGPVVDPVKPTDATDKKQAGEKQTVNFADLGGGGGDYNQYDVLNDKSIKTGTPVDGLNSFSQGENRTENGSWSGGTITKTDGGVKESGIFTKKIGNTTLPLQSSTEWSEDEASGLLTQTKVNQIHNESIQNRLGKKGKLSKKTLKYNKQQLEKKEAGNSYMQYKVVETKSGKKVVVKERVIIKTKQADEWKEEGKVKTKTYKKYKKVLSGKHDGEENGRPYFLIDNNKILKGTTSYNALLEKAKSYNRKDLSRSNYFPFSGDSNPIDYKTPLNQRESGEKITPQEPLIIGPPYSDEYLRSRGMDPEIYKRLVAEKQTKPLKYKSPFARRDRSHLKVRDNYTPMNYSSPFHQEQPNPQDLSTPPQQGGTIWDKIKSYGSDMPERIDKFIQHANYSPETDKPINAFQNQQWVGIITEWLQEQKQSMVEATNNKDKETQQKISASVNQLIQDVTTYSGKFLDWIARNSGDQAEGNAGGSVVSKGSKKDEKFVGDITFMGDQNTVIAIGEDGKLGIKSYGLENIKYVEDLDDGVFAKDDAGYAMFLEASGQLQKDAEAGKPLNENIVSGHSDLLLKNKDSILSWAFDPLYGQAWIQDFAKGNPNASFDVFMPESSEFDIDYLTDEIHGWLGNKLTEAYNKNAPQKPEQKGDAAQGIMDETLASVDKEKENKEGVYSEGEKEPQGPPQEDVMAQGPPPPQGPPMAYNSRSNRRNTKRDPKTNRALDLINKFRQL